LRNGGDGDIMALLWRSYGVMAWHRRHMSLGGGYRAAMAGGGTGRSA